MLAILNLTEQEMITKNIIRLDSDLQNRFTFYFDQLKQGNDRNTTPTFLSSAK